MSEASISGGKSFLLRLGYWAAELLLVFVGAYAAFWLTNYQQHQRRCDDTISFWQRLKTK